jgi:hypothetical protein
MRKKAKAKPKAKASRRSKFWPGLLLGGVIAASAVHFVPAWLKDQEQTAGQETTGTSPTPPKGNGAGSSKESAAAPAKAPAQPQPQPQPQPPPVPPAAGGLPFFRDPALAANLLTRLGMGESYPGSLLWKKADTLGWNAFGVLATSGSSVATTGTAGNTVTCLLESTRADRVEALRLIANVFDPQGEKATMARFKSLAQAVLNETRCPVTRQFLDAIDGNLSLQTESSQGRFTLAQAPLAPGTRWELTVESR